MSVKINLFCRKCSLPLIFLLLLQAGQAQNRFSKVDSWIRDNLKYLGGRAVVAVYKDGKMVYSHAENNLTGMQNLLGKNSQETG